MIQRASCVGELALRVLGRGRPAKITRTFQRSAYLRSGDDFVLLLWGEMKSPMTVNVAGEAWEGPRLRAGEECRLEPGRMRFDSGSVEVGRAKVHRSGLLKRRPIQFPGATVLTKGVATLRSLYDVALSDPALADDGALKTFVRRVVSPAASGRMTAVFNEESYLPLIGRGGGFTPAGDDFVGGFMATYNFAARCRKSRQALLPRTMLLSRTVPESAVMLDYAARGYVDEGLERLVMRTLGGGTPGFYDELLSVARRGHTSGIDMSLGVLLCAAALSSAPGESVLNACLEALWKQ